MVRCTLRAVLFTVVLAVLSTATAHAQAVTLSGKLIDRVCSVDDALGNQPSTEKRCTLWVESSWSCPTGTCTAIFTVYCPNRATDGRPLIGAYPVCSDPGGMQIRHATKTYIIQAYARTVAQQADGYGQFLGYQFQY